MKYTAVIRTLGTAGDKYQQLLDSLACQSIKPSEIIVYIAEGYPLPKETIGIERYVYVKKGMLSQRALKYTEVTTEYLLFLDDDLEFPPNTVEQMFCHLKKHDADVISPDIFPNADRTIFSELAMTISGRMRARRKDKIWGYKIMKTGGYSYNKYPIDDVYISQTNAGACFLCRKEDFLKINIEEELWIDKMMYPLGEDQVMYYKMYCNGLKMLTWYTHEFVHLDAGGNMTKEKAKMRLYGDVFFKTVFWHRFIFSPEKDKMLKIWDIVCIAYYMGFTLFMSFLRCNFSVLRCKWKAMQDACRFILSKEYCNLSKIIKS